MILVAKHGFSLVLATTPNQALVFVQDVATSLAHVDFVRDLDVRDNLVRANLVVDVPMLGEQRIDFESRVVPVAGGADLQALPLNGKAWAEVAGQARVTPNPTTLRYDLEVKVHLEVPDQNNWGGRVFEKMVHLTANSTLERVTRGFGAGVEHAAKAAFGGPQQG